MNVNERIRIGELWLACAAMFGKDIPRPALVLMLDAVKDLSAADVDAALRNWAKQSKVRSYPLPGDLRAEIIPVVDDDSIARNAAASIIEAIKKHGYTRPIEARELMGDVAWRTVERLGGWHHVCSTTMDSQLGTFIAQARDLAKAQIIIGRNQTGNNQLKIEPSNRIRELVTKTVNHFDI